MTINRQLANAVSKITIALLVLFTLLRAPASSWASGMQENQLLQQTATLVTPKLDDKISIYSQPNTRKRRIGYGIEGDTVTVLEKVGSNAGITWNHIRFDNPPYADGWVQDKFLLLPTNTQKQQPSGRNGNRYLGNQKTNTQNRSKF